MPRRPDRSPQTVAVLTALSEGDLQEWHYGYDLARRTGLQSGSLYPILARLAERGHAERRWEESPPGGRPPRHLYRLTPAGEALLAEVTSAAPAPASRRPVLGMPEVGGGLTASPA